MIEQNTQNNNLLAEIRAAFALYVFSEGCDCCRNTELHNEAENRLAELLKAEPYKDGSGFNWDKYLNQQEAKP